MPTTELSLLVVGAFALCYFCSSNEKRRLPLPPGPPGLPLVGKYGPVTSVTVLGRPIILVHSASLLPELDRASTALASRPRLEMGGELVGYNNTLVLLPYGPRFRTYRKHFAAFIGTKAAVESLDKSTVIQRETLRFLKKSLSGQQNLLNNLRTLAGGVILNLTYGITVQDSNDPYVSLIERANANFNASTIPGAFLVDFFPSLQLIPSWLPFFGKFKHTAQKWKKDTDAMVQVPFAYATQQIEKGSAPYSFVANLLRDGHSLDNDAIRDIKFAASSMYGGGADTTVSAEYAFFLAMVLYPDVQKQAQAELDSVIGPDALPTLADHARLPYISALVSEVLRWNTVAPTGVPHLATEDCTLGGYHVPKNSLVIANLWAMLHDPTTYPSPHTFSPARFLPPTPQPDPRAICFGFGRRVCPGQHLAHASLFLCVALSLAVLHVQRADGEPDGEPRLESTSGIISYPKEFRCKIRPRSAKALELVKAELEEVKYSASEER